MGGENERERGKGGEGGGKEAKQKGGKGERERKGDRTSALLQERLVQLLIDRKRPTRRWF